jgi:hypothetical protein
MMVPWSSCKRFSRQNSEQQKHKQDRLQMTKAQRHSRTSMADRFRSIYRSDPPRYTPAEGSQKEGQGVEGAQFLSSKSKFEIEAPQKYNKNNGKGQTKSINRFLGFNIYSPTNLQTKEVVLHAPRRSHHRRSRKETTNNNVRDHKNSGKKNLEKQQQHTSALT